MISPLTSETVIVSFMVSLAFILIFILTVLRFHSSKPTKDNHRLPTNYTALLINSNRLIEMRVPMNEMKFTPVKQYSIPRRTETIYPSNETSDDYYQSILSKTDLPYFPVRETTFQTCPRSAPQIVLDLEQNDDCSETPVNFV